MCVHDERLKNLHPPPPPKRATRSSKRAKNTCFGIPCGPGSFLKQAFFCFLHPVDLVDPFWHPPLWATSCSLPLHCRALTPSCATPIAILLSLLPVALQPCYLRTCASTLILPSPPAPPPHSLHVRAVQRQRPARSPSVCGNGFNEVGMHPPPPSVLPPERGWGLLRCSGVRIHSLPSLLYYTIFAQVSTHCGTCPTCHRVPCSTTGSPFGHVHHSESYCSSG